MNDRDLIDAFITYLQEHGHPGLQVDCWPENDNRNSPDIDAIAGAFAIECTSIDTLPNQRRDSDWFLKVVGGLEQELPSRVPFRLKITLEYEAVKKGQNWAAIRQKLKNWLANEAQSLLDGSHILEAVPNIPFRLHVIKKHGRRPGVIFGRFKADDHTLAKCIRELFDEKVNKLAKYHASGKTTVLLLDSWDYVLMDEWIMLESIQDAYPDGPPPEVDQIWYADTSIPNEIEFTDFTPDLQIDAPARRERR
jgi:hypothetical protein